MTTPHLGNCPRISRSPDRERFGDTAIARLDRHLQRLLLELTQDATRPLGAVPMLLPGEDARLVSGGAGGGTLEALLGGVGLAPALVAGGVEVSRAELLGRAGRLAARLRGAGVGPEVVVAVALERSPLLLEALLGVLMAGGAYLPLDPDFPPERLAFMLADSGACLLLTERHLRDALPAVAEVWCLDAPAEAPDALGWVSVDPRHPAYLIYTSGSTGRPKAVAVSHGPLAMHVRAIGARYGMGPRDRELIFMSLSFDGAHERWLTALATVGYDDISSTGFRKNIDGEFLTGNLGSLFSPRHIFCNPEKSSPYQIDGS
mgnify:CR=1 FL=1